MSRNTRIAAVAVIAFLLLALFFPALRWLTGEWLGNDYYSHGPLVPIISALVAWRLWRSWPSDKRRFEPSNLGLIPALAGLLIYLFALTQRAYFIASLAMILTLAGLVWTLLGTATLKRMAFPLLFLVFMVPLPFIEPFSVPLAQLTGAISGGVVRLCGVPIQVNGAQVTLPNANLIVGAQCSGLRSIVTLMTLVGLIIFIVQGPWQSKVLLALSAVVIAAFGNVLRVTSLLGVAYIWGADAGFKYYHDYSGIVFFLSAFALLLLFTRLLGCREIREDIF